MNRLLSAPKQDAGMISLRVISEYGAEVSTKHPPEGLFGHCFQRVHHAAAAAASSSTPRTDEDGNAINRFRLYSAAVCVANGLFLRAGSVAFSGLSVAFSCTRRSRLRLIVCFQFVSSMK